MIVAVYIAMLFFFRLAPHIWWHPQLFLAVAGVTTVAIGLGSAYKIICLREGGWVIAEQLGGREIIDDMANERERQLLNIVEEMAIASGIPVPPVYILDREYSINAFAAGFTINDAVIGVTRGCLDSFDRDELQGVIGHEFSHILNGDMGINLRLMGLLHGILFIYITGELLLRTRGGSRAHDKGMPLWALGLLLMAIGGIGLLCGRLIKAAVSRQREFLADASSVQFTRNPDAIAGALEKLANMDSRLISPHAESASHMFFGKVMNVYFWEEMLATHPPIEERIRRVRSVKVRQAPSNRTPRSTTTQDSLAMGFASSKATPEQVVNKVGTVAPENLTHVQGLLAQLPEPLRASVKDTQSAMAILFAFTLSSTNVQKVIQVEWLRQVQSEDVVAKTLALSVEIAQLDASIRLPLVDLVIPALRQLPNVECQRVCKTVQGLAKANGKLELWDFVLQLILCHRLQSPINSDVNTTQFNSIEEVWADCLLILSVLARVGDSNIETATYAFRSGIYRLPNNSELQKPDKLVKCNFAQVKKSLERLRLANGKIKQAVVDACAHTVLTDNKVTSQEADLLRAVCMTLDCPIPPFLNKHK
ncbi:peptidase M48 Ste24p [Calothrix sp. NIES-4071]|nr:peptidase M48 Ste24p [Calothrix sp. NIES-4071]BAZ55803.1 peptidase M48 Ste24p [Calothrix sp. NIES-4105]